MRYVICFLMMWLLTTGCGLQEKRQELDRKMAELVHKEQELELRARSLQLKEEDLARKVKKMDSSSQNLQDSFITLHPMVVGKWNVTMRCIQTTCPGSAVGDIKNEQWEISYLNHQIVAQAFSNNALVREYSGGNNDNIIELAMKTDRSDSASQTKMHVRIQEIKENQMRGEREIIRTDNCHILYALEFQKK